MTNTEPFRTLRQSLIETFGRPVHRVALDAGSTCPNRDGSKAFGGCVYCDVEGSGTGALKSGQDLAEQLERGIRRVARRDAGCGVIAYFQSYSNTYVERERLEEVLAVVEPWIGDPVVGVSIATRPDTLPDWSVELLAGLAGRVRVWVELGLEAADDGILTAIRRFHTVEDFRSAVARCHGSGLETVGHAILGLPGDGREGARRTARVLAECGVGGVKVHNLMVLKRTQLERDWRAGSLAVIDRETYVDWLADFVERLAPGQVLHRLTGDAPAEERVAPLWSVDKHGVKRDLVRLLGERGTRQGSLHASSPAPRGEGAPGESRPHISGR